MNDLTLQKARAYEAEHGAAISPAERPAYHMTPYVGWLNDPNGFSFYQGKYHQFYQYNPYDVRWAPMHWGHAVSTDLLHWEYLPCALAPDSPVDNGPGCFSGSATVMDDGKQLLMYTSVIAEKQPNGEMRDIQTQSIAIGDGLNYEKPACNPVLTQKDLPEGFSKFDFRDPKIWREADGTYSAVTVCLAEDGSGAAALFQSKDGFDWHFVTVLERCNNQYGKMWECPDFFPLDGKQVLMLGPMEMLPKGEFHNGHNVIAFIGSYDEATHTFTKENVQLMDGGIDFYATQTTLAPDGKGTRGCHAVRKYLRAFGDAAVFEHQHQLPRNAVVAPHSGGVRRKRITRQAQIIQNSEADRTNRVRQGQRAAGQAENVLRKQRIIHIGQKAGEKRAKSGQKRHESTSLLPQFLLMQINGDARALPNAGGQRHAAMEHFSGLMDEVQPQSGGFLPTAPVVAGISLLEHARHILRCNADACVCHDNRRGAGHANADAAAVGVLDSVGQQLVENEQQPFAVRQGAFGGRLVLQTQLLADEQGRKVANRLPNDRVKRHTRQHKVFCRIAQPRVA